MRRCRLLFLFLLSAQPLLAASLSGNLSPAEIDQVVQNIGAGSTTRLMRSAEAYPSWPGLKLGLEIAFVPSGELNSAGDATGSLPPVNPLPRLYVTKGLFMNLELTINFLPLTISGTISTLGGTLKWAFYDEQKHFLHGSLFLSYTSVSAYDDTFSGSNWEVGGVLSKDFVRLRPYLGFGVMVCRGSVIPALARTADNSGSHSTLHAFAGVEIDLPVSIGLQLDFMNLSPSGSFFIGTKF